MFRDFVSKWLPSPLLNQLGLACAGGLLCVSITIYILWKVTEKEADEFAKLLKKPIEELVEGEGVSIIQTREAHGVSVVKLPVNKVDTSQMNEGGRPTTLLKPGEHHVMSFANSSIAGAGVGAGSSAYAAAYASSNATATTTTKNTSNHKRKGGVRIISWNIEMGMQLPRIITELRRINADILLLQECDAYCSRSGNVDVAVIIASALGMQLIWACEFIELSSSKRESSQNKHTGTGTGHSQGNAILIKGEQYGYTIVNSWSFLHTKQPFNWEKDGDSLYGEPRLGGRVCVGAHVSIRRKQYKKNEDKNEDIENNDDEEEEEEEEGEGMEELYVYSAHLENNSGAKGRWEQFREICCDAVHRRRHQTTSTTVIDLQPRIIIGGDLNTLSAGLAKLLPRFFDCTWPRLYPWMHESLYWYSTLLPQLIENSHSNFSLCDPWATLEYKNMWGKSTSLVSNGKGMTNRGLLGMLKRVLYSIYYIITGTGTRINTVTNTCKLYSAKLDWILLEKTPPPPMPPISISTCSRADTSDKLVEAGDLELYAYDIGGGDRSDHLWLSVDLCKRGCGRKL